MLWVELYWDDQSRGMCFVLLFLYGPFCRGGLMLDPSTLFAKVLYSNISSIYLYGKHNLKYGWWQDIIWKLQEHYREKICLSLVVLRTGITNYFLFQNMAMQCYCFNDMVNQSKGKTSTCTVACDPYVCGSPNGEEISIYRRLDTELSE